MDRSIDWADGAIVAIDQRALPASYELLRIETIDELIAVIRGLGIRGAPALGVAGAFGVALSCHQHRTGDRLDREGVCADAARLARARPTAVNLRWGVEQALARLDGGAEAVLAQALALLADDERANRAAAQRAAELLRRIAPDRPLRLLTHCNTGRLATAGWGTALGAIRELAAAGQVESVLVTETRPLLQGARLTTWELAEAGVPHRLCVDSAAAAAMAAGEVDAVLVGADRIAANGDVANKIGTYALAVAAARHAIPFVVVAPESTLDPDLPDGGHIVIEQRPAAEVTGPARAGTSVYNPAFDVTPVQLITAITTEDRVFAGTAASTEPASTAPACTEPASTAQSGAEQSGPGERGPALALARVSQALYRRGWMDGTAGNLSVRLDAGRALITASGRSKGELSEHDAVAVDIRTDRPLAAGGPRPSAETTIHTALYRAFPDCGAVVHAHPPYATALTAAVAREGAGEVRFGDFELVKGLGSLPPCELAVPIFTNAADVQRIAAEVAAHYRDRPGQVPPVLLIGFHGATAWGPDLETARNRLECLEALCQLHLLTTDSRWTTQSRPPLAGTARRTR